MVRMSSDELAIYQAKLTPPKVIKAREEKSKQRWEKELQEQIKSLLHHRGIVFLCSKFGKKSTIKKGWPDFTFAINGKACAVEVKTGNNDLDPEQITVIRQMESNGWAVIVVRDLLTFKQFLDEMEKI